MQNKVQKSFRSQHPSILHTHPQNGHNNRLHLQLPSATQEKLPSNGLILNTHNLRPLPFLFSGRYQRNARPNLQSHPQQPSQKLYKQNTSGDANAHKKTKKHFMEKQSSLFNAPDQAMEINKRELEQTNDLFLKWQAEIKDLQQMRKTLKDTHDTLIRLKKQVDTLEERMIFTSLCKAGAKPARSHSSIRPHRRLEINIKQKAVAGEPNYFDKRRVNKMGKEEHKKGCQYWYGYLSQREKNKPIPKECEECKKAVECMLKQIYSSSALAEIKKFY